MGRRVLVVGVFLVLAVLLFVVVAAVIFFLLGLDFSSLSPVGGRPVDLGVEPDFSLLEEPSARNSVMVFGSPGDYCLDCSIRYSDSAPMNVSLSSVELTTYLQATQQDSGVLRDAQILLGDGEAEVSCTLDLSSYGYDFQGPVYARGSIERASSNSISIDLSEAKSGVLPVPGEVLVEGESELEDRINSQLSRMPGLRIDRLEIVGGVLEFEGEFPQTAEAQP